jgi:hypothetical protein
MNHAHTVPPFAVPWTSAGNAPDGETGRHWGAPSAPVEPGVDGDVGPVATWPTSQLHAATKTIATTAAVRMTVNAYTSFERSRFQDIREGRHRPG